MTLCRKQFALSVQEQVLSQKKKQKKKPHGTSISKNKKQSFMLQSK